METINQAADAIVGHHTIQAFLILGTGGLCILIAAGIVTWLCCRGAYIGIRRWLCVRREKKAAKVDRDLRAAVKQAMRAFKVSNDIIDKAATRAAAEALTKYRKMIQAREQHSLALVTHHLIGAGSASCLQITSEFDPPAGPDDKIKGPEFGSPSGPRLATDDLPTPPEFVARLRAAKQPDGSYRPDFSGHWLDDCRSPLKCPKCGETSEWPDQPCEYTHYICTCGHRVEMPPNETASDVADSYKASAEGKPVDLPLDYQLPPADLQLPPAPDGYEWRLETVQRDASQIEADSAGTLRGGCAIRRTYRIVEK